MAVVPSRNGRGGERVLVVNQGHITRYPRQRFASWRSAAEKELLVQTRPWRSQLPLQEPVLLIVQYWAGDRIVRDIAGMLDALGHLLEHAGLVTHDGLIRGLVWNEMPLDRLCPRVKLSLAPLTSVGGGLINC